MNAVKGEKMTNTTEVSEGATAKIVRRKKTVPHKQVRVTVTLSKPFFDKLEGAQEVTHAVNVSEVIKNAAKMFLILLDEQRKGNEVHVIAKDGAKKAYPIFSIE
jgi:hypothetical protein